MGRGGSSLWAFYVDIDDLKPINDTLCHAAGDATLVGVARALRSVLRASDTVARVGGDEFVAICEDVDDTFAVPASGAPLFQAATANLNPWTEAQVDTQTSNRGPLLIISGEKDNTVPWAIANASYHQQQHNPDVTEIVEIPNRGHALTIDSGWREVADTALAFVQRFVH